MAIPHAESAQVIDVRPLGDRLRETVTTTLVKTDRLEVIRLVLPAGKEIPRHTVAGEITIQCLEGRVELAANGENHALAAGDFVYLTGGAPHALRALEDASVLVTLLLHHS